MKAENIVLIWDRMGDYHRARWSAVEKVFTDRIVYAADLGASDSLYGWNNTEDQGKYFRLSQKNPNRFDWRRLGRFINLLSSKKITVICVAGYARPEYLFFILYAWLKGKKIIIFAESWYPSGKLIDLIKSIFLRCFCDDFLVSGKRAFDHFTHRLSIATSKVKVGYSVVDNDHFAMPQDFPVEQKKKKILLCVARFSPEKNLINLVEAFKESTMPSNGWELKLIGGGPMQNELEQRVKDAPVILQEWQSYESLPSIYAGASLFILPSTFEPWGLVVNEAMAAGLPIVVSTEVGCMTDFLIPGVNGWSFVPNEKENLCSLFNTISTIDIRQLNEMGKNSKQIIENFTTSVFSNNLKYLIESI